VDAGVDAHRTRPNSVVEAAASPNSPAARHRVTDDGTLVNGALQGDTVNNIDNPTIRYCNSIWTSGCSPRVYLDCAAL
jgi:hypothetical protein